MNCQKVLNQIFMCISSSRFLPTIHRSQAAPLSFPPFSFSPSSSSPRCLFDPGKCRRHCRSSPHLPSSSSCAYGTLEIRCITGGIINAILMTACCYVSKCWPIIQPSHWSWVHTCFLAQQPSGFQHSTSLQAALDGCFFLFASVDHLSNQLPAHSIVHGKPDRSSTVWLCKGTYFIANTIRNQGLHVTYFILHSQLPWLLSSYSNSSSSPKMTEVKNWNNTSTKKTEEPDMWINKVFSPSLS